MTDAEREQCVQAWQRACQNPGVAARKPTVCRHFARQTERVRMERLHAWRKVRHA